MDIAKLREKAAQLPLLPGVYQMKDKNGVIIYIGKAKLLKNRVSSYFQNTDRHTPKVAKMVEHVDNFEIIVANSEFDALVLENILIKRNQPRYNIKLKDGKGYPFIRLDMTEEYPRFTVEAKKLADKARYFGPYGGQGIAAGALDTISHALRLPSCSRKFPADIGKGRPCLNAHMNRCIAVCAGNVTREMYREIIGQAALLLDGKYEQLTSALEKEMNDAAELMKYERAAELRDRAEAIRRLDKKQKIITANLREGDAVAFASNNTLGAITLLHVSGGMLIGKFSTITESAAAEDEPELLSEFIMQYYAGSEGQIPRQIFLSAEPEDAGVLASVLSEQAGHKVELVLPQRGEKHALLELARINATDEAERAVRSEARSTKAAAELAALCGMSETPHRIEAFDISNTGNEGIVGSMAVYIDGKPSKRHYRKFKIRGTDTQDDIFSMGEVLSRRFADLQVGKEGFADAPDMILIDGGENQLRAALSAATELGVKPPPMFGMVKDDRHRTRALVSPDGMEIGLTAKPMTFALVGRIQEEAHRFAVTYHRSIRDNGKIKSSLDEIAGVGEVRRTALLKRFKSTAGIGRATPQELLEVVPHSIAEKVYKYYHGEKDGENGS